jgi:hypothetical protein
LKDKIARLEIPTDAQGHAVQNLERQQAEAISTAEASGVRTPPSVEVPPQQAPTTPPRVVPLNMFGSHDGQDTAPSPNRSKGSGWSWGWGEAVPQKLSGSSGTSPVVEPGQPPAGASDEDLEKLRITAAATAPGQENTQHNLATSPQPQVNATAAAALGDLGAPSPTTADADMRSWSIFNLVGRRRPASEPPTPVAGPSPNPSPSGDSAAAISTGEGAGAIGATSLASPDKELALPPVAAALNDAGLTSATVVEEEGDDGDATARDSVASDVSAASTARRSSGSGFSRSPSEYVSASSVLSGGKFLCHVCATRQAYARLTHPYVGCVCLCVV